MEFSGDLAGWGGKSFLTLPYPIGDSGHIRR
jgi:hypothetical protein